MIKKMFFLAIVALVSVAGLAGENIKNDIFVIKAVSQHKAIKPIAESVIAIEFDLADKWHFYADSKTAPAQMSLKFDADKSAKNILFKTPIYPKSKLYFDKFSDKNIQTFSGKFTVYLPFEIKKSSADVLDIKVTISGSMCSDNQCRPPEVGSIDITLPVIADADMAVKQFEVPENLGKNNDQASQQNWGNMSVWAAIGLAVLAGLSLNIMPCIWPVLPIVIMKIVAQAKEDKSKSIALGIAFCSGILLFFAVLAGANIVLQLIYGTVLQWGDQFRNPAFVAVMGLLLVGLALFMFGVFAVSVPSAVSSKAAGTGKTGFVSTVSMGFLAAVLSTPCSFGILAAAFAWAQSQNLILGTITIMVIGLGMAVPYLILTAMPSLLKRLPKSGQWMELFKQTIGFVLLIIAIKLIMSLPNELMAKVMYFSLIASFALWMWGSWVTFNMAMSKKVTIRLAAIILTSLAAVGFFVENPDTKIDWQHYDTVQIQKAINGKRPVLIKFTAKWCMSCQLVEKTVYGKKELVTLLKQKNVLMIKADTTEKDFAASVDLKNIYNEPGVPVTVLYVPSQVESHRFRGVFFADEMTKILSELTSDSEKNNN